MRPVVGDTGLLEAENCRRLRRGAVLVRGLVRPGSPREAGLAGLGVEVVHGALRDRSSLAAAWQGMTAVISTASSTASRRPGTV